MTTTYSERKFNITQYLDGDVQYDPIWGGADGGKFTVPYSQHRVIEDWVRTNTTGLVNVSYEEKRPFRKRTWEVSDVTFSFTNSSEAVLAKLTFGGAA